MLTKVHEYLGAPVSRRALLFLAAIVVVIVMLLSNYLTARRDKNDIVVLHTRESICIVLEANPPTPAQTPIQIALYDKVFSLENCAALPNLVSGITPK